MGRFQNVFSTAVVLLQLNNRAVGIIFFKIQNVLKIGSPPGIYALPVVAYHCNIFMSTGKQFYQLILGGIGILVLVNHYISELGLPFLADLRLGLQQIYSPAD